MQSLVLLFGGTIAIYVVAVVRRRSFDGRSHACMLASRIAFYYIVQYCFFY